MLFSFQWTGDGRAQDRRGVEPGASEDFGSQELQAVLEAVAFQAHFRTPGVARVRPGP